MTDTSFFIDLLNKALENPAYILFGIGFILICIFLGLLTRKDRKANPEKWARIDAATTAAQNNPPVDNPMGVIHTANGMHTYTRVGNTTYIH